MTSGQPTLFDAVAAGRAGTDAAASHADPRWLDAARWHIRALLPGQTFLAEQIARSVEERGLVTSDRRALGAVIREAASAGLIEPAGFAPARTSHGSPKRLWRRCTS